MKTTKRLTVFLWFAMVLSACNIPARTNPATPTIDNAIVSTIAAMTLQAIPTQVRIITLTPTVLVTPTPTSTITQTYTVPMILFEGNTNCRSGPGTSYDVITVVLNGQKAEAIGVSENGSYWLIKNPNKGDPCWVAGDLAKPSGSVLQLPTMAAPPTPTSIPPTAPAWSAYNYTCDFASGGSTITMNLVWTDRSNNEEGYTVYRDKQAVTTLAPNTSTFVDVAFVASGQTISYSIEVFNKAGRASSSTITASCQ